MYYIRDSLMWQKVKRRITLIGIFQHKFIILRTDGKFAHTFGIYTAVHLRLCILCAILRAHVLVCKECIIIFRIFSSIMIFLKQINIFEKMCCDFCQWHEFRAHKKWENVARRLKAKFSKYFGIEGRISFRRARPLKNPPTFSKRDDKI